MTPKDYSFAGSLHKLSIRNYKNKYDCKMKILTPEPSKLLTAKILFMVNPSHSISRLAKKMNLRNRITGLNTDKMYTTIYIKLSNYIGFIIAFNCKTTK